MLNNIKKRNEGFTIIEVLIVLAIAGLIILIVFLAVPALQRNSRNTSMKNGASAVAGAVSDFVAANNGKLPASNDITIGANDGLVTVGAAGSSKTEGKVKTGTTYSAAKVTGGSPAGTLSFHPNNKCNDAGNDITPSNRSFAVLYVIETGSTTKAVNCIEG